MFCGNSNSTKNRIIKKTNFGNMSKTHYPNSLQEGWYETFKNNINIYIFRFEDFYFQVNTLKCYHKKCNALRKKTEEEEFILEKTN